MRAVLVTTENRGVFFGYLKEDCSPNHVILTNARNCIYWSKDCQGFMGLAAKGPVADSRIGPSVSEQKLLRVTSITNVSEEAEKLWISK